MITPTLTTAVETMIAQMTGGNIATQRQMERARFIIWQHYIAASNLYMGMLGKPTLFDEDETDAQYETCRNLEDSHNALDQTYHRLYQQPDGAEQD